MKQFAIRYVDTRGLYIRTAWQDSIARIRDMADYFESQQYEIIAFLVRNKDMIILDSRCPECGWPVEDGSCLKCGLNDADIIAAADMWDMLDLATIAANQSKCDPDPASDNQ